jgi:TP901 family phage tail tape measure protein
MTAAAVLVAKATKGEAEAMTSLFATGYGIFKKQYASMGDADFGNLFGGMISKSVQVFKTKGSEMQAAIEAAGASATNYGMTMQDQFATLGQLQRVMSGSEAGTALKGFASQAAAADKNFAKMAITANHPVRVRILDDKGMMRSMPDILANLKARYGETLDAIEGAEIKEAFGSDEAVKIIQNLYGQEAAVRANAEALREAGAQGEKFTKTMADAADNNFDSRMIKLSQSFDVIKQKLATALLPSIERILPPVERAMSAFTDWADANPNLAGGVGAVVVGVTALASVLSPMLFMLSGVTAGYAKLANIAIRAVGLILNPTKILESRFVGFVVKFATFGARLISGIIPALMRIASVMRIVGMVFLANPILMVIAAIAGAAYLIYANWDTLVPYFNKLWEGVKFIFFATVDAIKFALINFTPFGIIYNNWGAISAWFSGLWQGVKGIFSGGVELIKFALLNFTAPGLIYNNWAGIVGWFGGLWGRVSGAFSGGWAAIRSTVSGWAGQMAAIGGNIVAGLASGIMRAPGAVWNALRSIVMGGIGQIKAFLGIKSPSRLFMGIGGHMTDGLAIGITGKTANASAAMVGLADRVTRSFAPKFGVGAALGALALSPAAAQSGTTGAVGGGSAPALSTLLQSRADRVSTGGGAGASQYVYNLTINLPPGSASNPEDVAAAVERALAEHAETLKAEERTQFYD